MPQTIPQSRNGHQRIGSAKVLQWHVAATPAAVIRRYIVFAPQRGKAAAITTYSRGARH